MAEKLQKNLSHTKFQGNLSQEIFVFETAQLERVLVEKIEIIKKPGWWGMGAKEEWVTKEVPEWRVKKISGMQAERFIEDLGNGVQLEMVYVSAGSFTMGSDEDDSEKPPHVVNLPGFYLGRYQVTQEQYLRIMGENPAHWQEPHLPVEQVSWHSTQRFCQKLNAETGKKYRLPSEAEWEYACRAGTDTPFYFGETLTTDVANYHPGIDWDEIDFSGFYDEVPIKFYREKTTLVGSFPANGFGLHDMHGNVCEWCEDKWHDNYQGAPTNGSAWVNGDNNDYRVRRGGGWGDDSDTCCSASRDRVVSDIKYFGIGFRIVCVDDN
jgi:eukaryotic-like serine/threonine-protein kinase